MWRLINAKIYSWHCRRIFDCLRGFKLKIEKYLRKIYDSPGTQKCFELCGYMYMLR